MSRAKQVGKSVSSTLAANVISLAISVAFLAYFGRKLPKQEMALFAYVTTLASWVTLFSGLGLATLACREVPTLLVQGKTREAKCLISSAVAYRTVLGVVIAAVLFLLSPFLSRQAYGTVEYAAQFRIISCMALLMSAYGTLSLMQWALQRFHVRAVADLLSTTGGRILAVGGYFWLGFDGFLLGFGLGTLMAGAVQLWSLRDFIGRELLGIKVAVRQGASYTGADMLRNLLMNLDQPIVGFLIGDAALADFFVAKRLYATVWGALQSVVSPVGAKISEVKVAGAAALNDYFRKSIVVIAFLFIPAGFAMITMSWPMIHVLLGAKYESAAPILSLYGVAMVFGCTYEIWYDAVMRLLPGHFMILQNAVISVATYGMYFVFLPLWGAKGIPLATACGYVAALAVAGRLLYVRAKVRFPSECYYRSVGCGLFVLAATWSASFVADAVAGLALMSLAAVVSMVAGVLVLAPPEARSWMQRLWSLLRSLTAARVGHV